MPLILRQLPFFLTLAALLLNGQEAVAATKKKPNGLTVAYSATVPAKKKPLRRYQTPGYVGKDLKEYSYRNLTLIGAVATDSKAVPNRVFFHKIKEAIDLIETRTPDIFNLMRSINSNGRRVIYYTGTTGPASFVSWKGDYVVNITASNIDPDPVFENSVYTLAASLVHELVGHGRQEEDNRLWDMYDWCGKDSNSVEGVLRQANHTGSSSGFVEYEANLFAKWFLESVRGKYPDLNEKVVRRYVRLVRVIKKRFPGWYDDRQPATALLSDFKNRFKSVCPNTKFTPHPVGDS